MEYEVKLIENLNEFIKEGININYRNENKEIIIQKDDMTISFSSTYIQKLNEISNSNSTVINLGKCEKNLKTVYNISDESYLYMLKIDKEQRGKNYPQIEYEVFYPLSNGKIEILNLSYCEGIDIEILIPIIINETIDKYNPKSDYYNNICSKTNSKSNIDIPLNDRRNEYINNNMSLCEENCDLENYDYNKKRAKCSCKVKTTVSINKIKLDGKNLLKNFIDVKNIMNIEIIKCYKIVFNKKILLNNLGCFIFVFIFLLYFICLHIFYCKSLGKLIRLIRKITKDIKYFNNKENQITNNDMDDTINKNKRTKKENRKRMMIEEETKSSSRKINNNIMIMKENDDQKSDIMNKKERKKNIQIIKIKRKGKKEEKCRKLLEDTESELNSLDYEEALKRDKRTYLQYYYSLLKKNQAILFSFVPYKDYNSQTIKIFLFFFFYVSDITINALFFTDDTMHKIYVDSGMFNLNYQLPQIIYSSLISRAINLIIEFLSSSESVIISIKTEKITDLKNKRKKISNMKIKFYFFFVITFILLLIFCYYIICFCCIYQNTQMHLIKDSLIGFGFSLIYPFIINLIPGIFRIWSLNTKEGDKICLYKLSQIIESI